MNLNVDYEQTKATGSTVQSYASEFKTCLDRIKSTNSNLESHWRGSDASKYTEAITRQAETMENLQRTIDEIGQFLTSVGKAYEEARNQNASAIR